MKDVFDNEISEEVTESQGEPEAQQVEATQPEAQTEATPPVADTPKVVPLAALEAERTGRRDWKEKALRYEGELKALRERPQQEREQQQFAPEQVFAMRQETILLNASERMARKLYGDEEVNKAFEKVMQNPALHAQALESSDPWDFVVQEGKKLAFLEEVGTDPTAYRAKIEAEIRASLNPAPAPRAPLPASLAGARSSAARTAPGFTGPTPINDLFG